MSRFSTWTFCVPLAESLDSVAEGGLLGGAPPDEDEQRRPLRGRRREAPFVREPGPRSGTVRVLHSMADLFRACTGDRSCSPYTLQEEPVELFYEWLEPLDGAAGGAEGTRTVVLLGPAGIPSDIW